MDLSGRVSVDNMTLVADDSGRFKSLVEDIGFDYFINGYGAKFPYHYTWECADGSIVQYADETKAVKAIRVEFNPNKCIDDRLIKVLSTLKYPKLTRLDVAFDFEEDLSEYDILDMHSRKTNEWKSGLGRLETKYIGAPTSPLRIRIYDKALEQKIENEKVWWRVEAQMRSDWLDFYNDMGILINPFDGLIIKKSCVDHIDDIRERAMVYYLLNEGKAALSSLSKNSRAKYKKILATLPSDKEIRLSDLFESVKDNVREIINKYMFHARKNDIVLT